MGTANENSTYHKDRRFNYILSSYWHLCFEHLFAREVRAVQVAVARSHASTKR
jgi:hypothetical protein